MASEIAMNKTLTLLPLTLLFTTGVAFAQEKAKPLPSLAKSQARALMHNKRVLVVINAAGEDLAKSLKGNRALSRKLLYEFETIAFTGTAVAKKWQWQGEGSGVVVTDAAGKELGRFTEAELAGKAALTKLEPLFCKPVSADKKLAAAMVEAKKSGRKILIRFDAPW
ncbi:MAG: hypothetical protein ACJA0V_001174 [Planctomycetota bacterium]|jgi:hypothetical protein